MPPPPPPPVAALVATNSRQFEVSTTIAVERERPRAADSFALALRPGDQQKADANLQKELVSVAEMKSLDLLMECVDDNLPRFTALHASTALVWVARIVSSKANHAEVEKVVCQDPRFIDLVDSVRSVVSSMAGSMMSGVVWALAKLGIRDDRLLRRVGDKVAGDISLFKPSHYLKLCWGFARARYRHDDMLNTVSSSAMKLMDKFNPIDICNILWAFSEFDLVETNSTMYNRFLERLLTNLKQHDAGVREAQKRDDVPPRALVHPSDLLGLVVVVTKFQDSLRDVLVDRLVTASIAYIAVYKSSIHLTDVFGLLWALAKREMWEEASEVLQSRGDLFESHDSSHMSPDQLMAGFWALGVIRVNGRINFPDKVERMGQTLAERGVQACFSVTSIAQLSRLLWGFVSSGFDHGQELFVAASEPALQLLQNAVPAPSPSCLCCLLWCFAAQGVRHRGLFKAVADQLVEQTGRLPWSDLADALWACAVVDLSHPEFLAAAAERVVAERGAAHGVGFADIVRAAWSFTSALAKLALQSAAVRALLPPQTMASAMVTDTVDNHPPLVWALLHQVLTVQECFQDQQYGEWRDLAANHSAGRSRGSEAARNGSRLRSEVRAALQAKPKPDTAKEEIARVAGRSRTPVDVAVPSRKLAFDAECEALTVYDIEIGRRVPNGAAQLRRQSLDREGWTLRLVPLALFSTNQRPEALQELLSHGGQP